MEDCASSHIFKFCRLILKVKRKCWLMYNFLLPTKTEWVWALLQWSTSKVTSEGLHGYLCRPLWSDSILGKQSERSTHNSNTLISYLYYQPQEQSRRNILSPLLRKRYLALFLSSYTTLDRSPIPSCSLLEGNVMLQSCWGFVSQLSFLFFLACLASYITGRRSSAKGWFFNSNRFWAGQTGDS